MKMQQLAEQLRKARADRGLSLEAASGAAKISTAYLHKLEAGGVTTPSPHVLRRLAQVLGVPYRTLMELAGYLDPEPVALARAEDQPTAPEGEDRMKSATGAEAPTNAEIVRLLEALRSELGALRHGQEELLKRLEMDRSGDHP